MVLQNIIFPSSEICNEEQLYFHKEGVRIVADSYFNSFSLGKWKKYTDIDSMHLVLGIQGSFRAVVFHQRKNGREITQDILCETILKEERNEIRMPDMIFCDERYSGNIGFSLEPIGQAKLLYGWYEGNSKKPFKEIRLAIDICTYRREKYVEKNIEILENTVIEKGNVEIFIIDNGKTLKDEELSKESIHIYKNKNVGGVGGFTRGMIEVLQRNCFTHVLIMDDDVVINPHAIELLMTFLSIRKDDYDDMTVGGAMLLLSEPYMQFEAGARWVNMCGTANHGLFNLKEPIKVLVNEEENIPVDYFAWWFCCYPVSIIRDDNLPLPIFVHVDDVEYGLRISKNMVTLNGVCVWHEDFDNKFSATMQYYDQRNSMIVSAIHKPSFTMKQHKKILFREITREMMKLRYNYARMRLRGAEDFLKGVDWLAEQDGERLHQEIMRMDYKFIPIEQCGISKLCAEQKSQTKSWKRLEVKSVLTIERKMIQLFRKIKSLIKKIVFSLTFNGLLLPPKREAVIAEPNPSITKLFRAKTAIHYNLQGKGYVTHRSIKEVFDIYYKYVRIVKEMNLNYRCIRDNYRKAANGMMGIKFWKKYLQI